jgi:hypothetical protein
MVGWTNDEVRTELVRQREAFRMQLALVFDNQHSDRNIGASIRNANVYNCEQVVVAGRRKFNRRGTVGTHLYTPVRHVDSLDSDAGRGLLDGYDCWVVHPTYPFLHNHYVARAKEMPTIAGKKRVRSEFETFIRCDDERLTKWLERQASSLEMSTMTMLGGQSQRHAGLQEEEDVYLCDPQSVLRAVSDVFRQGKKGIAVMVHEEGITPSPAMVARAHRVLHVVHPRRLCTSQRGLPPSLISAVSLGMLRRAIDTLK